MKAVGILISVLAIGACGTGDAHRGPAGIYPFGLQGCWILDDPYVDAIHSEKIEIDGSSMTVVASWMGGKPFPVTARNIESRTDTSLRGSFTRVEEGDDRSTYATEIGLGIRGAPADRLVVVEGDAGSRWLSRCKKVKSK